MPRALLACLLLLSACAPEAEKDPEGTLVMGENPYYVKGESIVIAAGNLGDSRYFRLPDGTISFTLSPQLKTDYSLLRGCAVKVELKDHSGITFKELYDKSDAPFNTTIRVNIPKSEIYYLSFDSDYELCIPVVIIQKV